MFLTLEDPNAKLKGSRDPLGIQPLWSAFGRHIVSNLTMQTTSVRGFTIFLLGRYLGAQLIDSGQVPPEEALAVFLRTEQLGAYVRHVAHDVQGDIRGIERVRTLLREKRGRVDIQADRRGYILSDQKVVGLWGLYTVAARTSGWIPMGPVGIERIARELVEHSYRPTLEPAWPELLRLVARGGTLNARWREPLFEAMAAILPESYTPEEIDFYGRFLRDAEQVGRAPTGQQLRFRRLLESETELDAPLGRVEMVRLVESAKLVDLALSGRLERIVKLESVLAPAGSVFDFLLTRHGRRPSSVAQELKSRWGSSIPNLQPAGFRELQSEIVSVSTALVCQEIVGVHDALAAGEYEDAIRSLLSWNALVMQGRGSGPWVGLDPAGRLDVRYRGAEWELPDAESLSTLWRNGYYIDSLKRITKQLRVTR
ncbi:MAG: hypothetical protein ACI8PT_004355 [Gammaproteobacteria bacterium]